MTNDLSRLAQQAGRMTDALKWLEMAFEANAEGNTPHAEEYRLRAVDALYGGRGDVTADVKDARLRAVYPLVGANAPSAVKSWVADQVDKRQQHATARDLQGHAVKFCGNLKTDGHGQVSGYLVLFGDESTPDLQGDIFTPQTDFGFRAGQRVTNVLYQHGTDRVIGKSPIGSGVMGIDNVGVWIRAQLDTRSEYVRAIWEMAKNGLLGWSSGSASHLVEREKRGRVNVITRWPLGIDASLTPSPADYRNLATT